jgi:hypothetical protein
MTEGDEDKKKEKRKNKNGDHKRAKEDGEDDK